MGSLNLQSANEEEEDAVVYLGDDQPIVVKPKSAGAKLKQQQTKGACKYKSLYIYLYPNLQDIPQHAGLT